MSFADDLNLFLQNKDRNANEVLSRIYDYCCSNRLVINFEKCCFMEFGKSKTAVHDKIIGILNFQFKKVDKCEFFDVIINSDLSCT